ncbi:MAG: metallophosphoesterase [Desulfobacterales bacterium]|nr:MAG: metallophosphoesterase [Desulfobacterales bacterium]
MHDRPTSIGRRSLIILAGLAGILWVSGALGFWMGYQAQKTAARMQSYEWIHNARGLKKISDSPDPGPLFKFAVFGDIQRGTAQLPRLRRVIEDEAPMAFVVQTGDAVSHPDAGHYRLFLDAFARAQFALPFLVVPGNHDVDHGSETLFEQYFGPRQVWFEYGRALFILADNALGPLDEAQYHWLAKVLADHRQATEHIFLFMHLPPINWEGDGGIPVEHLYARLFAILKSYRVDYVFCGNWHGYHREERDGTVFVVNGRGGDYDHDARLVPCYSIVVEVRRDAVLDRVIELAPRISIVLQSEFRDLFVAHIGARAMQNPGLTAALLLLLGASGVVLSMRVKKRGPPDRRDITKQSP